MGVGVGVEGGGRQASGNFSVTEYLNVLEVCVCVCVCDGILKQPEKSVRTSCDCVTQPAKAH